MASRGRTDSRRPGTKRSGSSVTTKTKPTQSTTSAPKQASNQRGVATTTAKPKSQKADNQSKFTSRAGILLLVLFLLVVSYTSSFHSWWNQKQEIAALELRRDVAETEIAELKDIESRWQDPAFIRNQARERFGWVMPGEVGYRVIGLDGELQGDGPTLDTPEALPEETWLDRLRSSIEKVDHPEIAEEAVSPNPDKVLKKKDS